MSQRQGFHAIWLLDKGLTHSVLKFPVLSGPSWGFSAFWSIVTDSLLLGTRSQWFWPHGQLPVGYDKGFIAFCLMLTIVFWLSGVSTLGCFYCRCLNIHVHVHVFIQCWSFCRFYKKFKANYSTFSPT